MKLNIIAALEDLGGASESAPAEQMTALPKPARSSNRPSKHTTGRGAALATPNRDAERLVVLPFAGRECLCIIRPETHAILSKHPVHESGHRNSHPSCPATYSLDEIEGKGVGMRAACEITAGKLILLERPLFIVQTMSAKFDYESALEHLRQDRREALFRLSNCKRSVPGLSELAGIVRTNALSVGLPKQKFCASALCELICRVNHSCTPNAIYYCDKASFCVGLRALSNIPAGVEITIGYNDPFQSTVARRAELLRGYGFLCDCDACIKFLSGDLTSDERRRKLSQLIPIKRENAERLAKQGGCNKAYVARVLKLLDEEGLVGERASIIAEFAAIANSQGSRAWAKSLARQALSELEKVECEDASTEWRRMRRILNGV